MVDLSNPEKLYSDELESFYYEFQVDYTSLLNPEAVNALQQRGGYYTKYSVLAVETDTDDFDFYAVKFLQHIDASIEDPNLSDLTYGNLDNFTGIVQLTDQNKKLNFSKEFHLGKATDVIFF